MSEIDNLQNVGGLDLFGRYSEYFTCVIDRYNADTAVGDLGRESGVLGEDGWVNREHMKEIGVQMHGIEVIMLMEYGVWQVGLYKNIMDQ